MAVKRLKIAHGNQECNVLISQSVSPVLINQLTW